MLLLMGLLMGLRLCRIPSRSRGWTMLWLLTGLWLCRIPAQWQCVDGHPL